MKNIYEEIAEKISDQLGYNVVFSNDENVNDNERTQTRGVLRINTGQRGVDSEVYTERVGMYISFMVLIEEETKFMETLQRYLAQYQSQLVDLKGGTIAKFVYGPYQNVGAPTIYSGTKVVVYQLDLDCYLYDNALMSDDLSVTINGHILKGVTSFVNSYSVQRDSHIMSGSNIPVANGAVKFRTFTIDFTPTKDNDACSDIFKASNNMLEESLELAIKWPVGDNPLIEINTTTWINQFDTMLNVGSFGTVKVVLSEYKKVM